MSELEVKRNIALCALDYLRAAAEANGTIKWDVLTKAYEDIESFIEGATGFVALSPKPEEPLRWEPLPDPEGGQHMTKEVWLGCVECHAFMDDDGFGHYASETQMTNKAVYPSDVVAGTFDPSYTHIVWFNK